MKIRNTVACVVGMAIIGASSITSFAGQKYSIRNTWTVDEEEYNSIMQAYGSTDMRYVTDNEERARIILDAQVKGYEGAAHTIVFDDHALMNTGSFDHGAHAYRIDGVWWVYARVPQAKGDARIIWVRYRRDDHKIAEIVTELPVGAWSSTDEAIKNQEETLARAKTYSDELTNIKDIEW